MKKIKWWMRIVGIFYLFLFVAVVFLQKPIQVEGPKDTLALAASGDPLANFVVDTWFTLGMGLLALGIALLIASQKPHKAVALVWTILGWEFFRGIIVDIYKLSKGTYPTSELIVWIIIHSLIILTGFWSLGALDRENSVRA